MSARFHRPLAWLLAASAFLAVAGATVFAEAGCGDYLVIRAGRHRVAAMLSADGNGGGAVRRTKVDTMLPSLVADCHGKPCYRDPSPAPPCKGPHCRERSEHPHPITPPPVTVVSRDELLVLPAIITVRNATPEWQRPSGDSFLPRVSSLRLFRPPRV